MALVTTTLAGAITASQTTVKLTAYTSPTTGSIGPDAILQVDSELMLVTDATNSPSLSVVRGYNNGPTSSNAAAHNTLAPVTYGLTSDFNVPPVPQAPKIYNYATNGALTVAEGTHFLNAVATTGVTFTLAAPTKDQAGLRMKIILTAAVASTVTNLVPGFINGGGSDDVASFAGAIGDTMDITAADCGTTMAWIPTILKGVTLG